MSFLRVSLAVCRFYRELNFGDIFLFNPVINTGMIFIINNRHTYLPFVRFKCLKQQYLHFLIQLVELQITVLLRSIPSRYIPALKMLQNLNKLHV